MRRTILWSGLVPLGLCVAAPLWAQSVPGVASTRDGVVHAASYFRTASGCDGTTHPVLIRLEPNPTGSIQVGFFESSAGAVGPQWRAAGWMAALVAMTALGQDLRSSRISYTLEGRIDGPSAGALTTCGLLAVLRGASIPEDVSMTGAVNPDGTIGPVGGIPHKILGAARAGKKRFAVPLGQRRDFNLCTGNEEDCVALGREHNVEVVEVGDIREAYAFLTGQPLPAPASASVSTEVPEAVRAVFREACGRWLARFKAAEATIQAARPGELTPELASFRQIGLRLARTGQEELASGHEPAAFNRIWVACVHAEFVARGVLAMRALLPANLPGLHSNVAAELEDTRRHIEGRLAELRKIEPATVLDAEVVAALGGQAAAALAYLDHAQRLLEGSVRLSQRAATPEQFTEVGLMSFEAIGHANLARSLAEVAADSKVWLGQGGPALPSGSASLGLLAGILELYRSAALSNLEYFDALQTAQLAEQSGVDLETAKSYLRRHDLTYLTARGSLEQGGSVQALFADLRAAAMAQVGALLLTVSSSSLLVAQHYSLEAQTDKLGRVVGFGREAALVRMTEVAEAEALRAVGEAAAATGGVSTPVLLAQIDAARRNRDVSVTPQDRLSALSLFWNTTLHARLLCQLASGS
jgi:predicted S18 family serine protease